MMKKHYKQDSERVAEIIAAGMKGKSRTELARRCGVTPQSVNGWITTGRVSKKYLPLIADYIGVDVVTLINDEPPRAIYDPAFGSGHFLQEIGRGLRYDSESKKIDRINSLLRALDFLTTEQIEEIVTSAKKLAEQNRAAFFDYLEQKTKINKPNE